MQLSYRAALYSVIQVALALRSEAVMFLDTGDVTHNSSTPGDNSGWQYEGKFNYFLGVPIAPHFFITAKHIGGSVGDTLDFHGDIYTTIALHDIPSTDLRIWEVDHSKPFPTYAPLSSGAADVGSVVTVLGRGTQRGAELVVSGEPKGWLWGPGDSVKRWGRNKVEGLVSASGLGQFIYCDFDNPGVADECHLSVGDSGGGVFVLENGLWRLAGINYAVDGPFREPPAGSGFSAVLYDCGGLEYFDDPNWIPIANGDDNVPSSFYSSRISASTAAILGITGGDGSLAQEGFPAWRKLYFTPAQIASPSDSGAQADFDGDGINNLLEFALNLDPTFNESAIMAPGTGLRGLPVCRLETISGSDYLTIEFVRRKPASGANLTYIQEYSSDLETWTQLGTEAATSINDRWERVKFTDTLTTNDTQKRFVRLRVVLSE